jgi:release factor glutamine methyltransferase
MLTNVIGDNSPDQHPPATHQAGAGTKRPSPANKRQEAKGGSPAVKTEASPIWEQVVWKLMSGTTIGRALNAARQRLEDAGCDGAHLDAQVLLAHVLKVERSWLFAHYEYELSTEEADAFTALVTRRMRREPVAYLVGHREFYGLDFLVDHRVLIPRPETELLVDAVIDHIAMREEQRIVVADVGTGSGAIALAVAANCPNVKVYAIDLSSDALAVARSNVQRLDARGQVVLLEGDLLTPLPEPVDMIVANLPYIRTAVYPQLMADVRDYEPQLALEAGPEGLDAIMRLLRQAPLYLNEHGLLFLEIGHDQAEAVVQAVRTILPQARSVRLRQDYHGHDRLVMIAL